MVSHRLTREPIRSLECVGYKWVLRSPKQAMKSLNVMDSSYFSGPCDSEITSLTFLENCVNKQKMARMLVGGSSFLHRIHAILFILWCKIAFIFLGIELDFRWHLDSVDGQPQAEGSHSRTVEGDCVQSGPSPSTLAGCVSRAHG